MQIWIDADACPVVVKEIIFRAAERLEIHTILVANRMLRTPPSRFIRAIQVPSGFDVADAHMDNTYLLWGHDNGIMGAWGVHDIHTSLQGRLARLWRVSEVNTSGTSADVGNVDITFDLNGLGPVTAADLRLVVDLNEDGTMANDTPISGATDLGGGLFRFSNVSAIANGRGFTIGTTNAARTPLPVTLLEFTGESQPTGVRLRWSTASEQNSDFFQVERSPDLLTWAT